MTLKGNIGLDQKKPRDQVGYSVLERDWKDLTRRVEEMHDGATVPSQIGSAIFGVSCSILVTIAIYQAQVDMPTSAILYVGYTAAPLLCIIGVTLIWRFKDRANGPAQTQKELKQLMRKIEEFQDISKGSVDENYPEVAQNSAQTDKDYGVKIGNTELEYYGPLRLDEPLRQRMAPGQGSLKQRGFTDIISDLKKEDG